MTRSARRFTGDDMIERLTEARFMAARMRVLAEEEHRSSGIGTLSEKTMHRMLKLTVEPDEAYHEQTVDGRVADIVLGEEIVEIQTRSLSRLRPKLAAFLPTHRVHVLYPMPKEKRLCWINPETGELGAHRRSPKTYTAYDSLPELSRLTDLLANEHLSLYLVLLDVDEYRYLDGWDRTHKRGSTRAERMANRWREVIPLRCAEEYRAAFLPKTLAAPFTVKDYAKAARIKPRWAYAGIRLLMTLGILAHCGTRGREYLYQAL